MKNTKTARGSKLLSVMLLLLSAALLLCACANNAPAPTPTAPATEPSAEPTPETTPEATPEATPDTPEAPTGASGLSSAEDVSAFLDQVYSVIGAENLPMMIGHMPLDLTDMDAVTYNTGLTSVEGIDGIVVSESGVGSIAYSLVYVMTADGADADAIQAELMEKINPAKWICVSADKIISVQLDSDVLLVMGTPEMAETVYNAVVETAEGTFTTIGEKVEN